MLDKQIFLKNYWAVIKLSIICLFYFWKNLDFNECSVTFQYNHIEAATASKFALEQRQREEAAERKADGTRWETKLFDQDDPDAPITGETKWDYKTPLADRLRRRTLDKK